MRFVLMLTMILASTSFAAEKPRDVYCFGEFEPTLHFTFKVRCTQGSPYVKKASKMLPDGEELIEIEKNTIEKMKHDGFQLVNYFRKGQVVVLKKVARSNDDEKKDVCLVTTIKNGVFTKDKYPYSFITPGAVLDCSEGADLDLQAEDEDERTATDIVEQSGFKKVAQFGPVSIYEK